jgi:hypothetical protein
VLPAACLLAPDAGAVTISVRSGAQFQAAVATLERSGGTIVLERHVYRSLVVGPRSSRRLRIVGRPGARVVRIHFDRTRNVSLGRVTIAPGARDAHVLVEGSSGVDLHDLVVTAVGTRRAASIELPRSRYVSIRRSTFNHCGDRVPYWVFCISPRPTASHVRIEDNRFHDCLGCDFIHGRFRSDLTIRRNTFDRALPCAIRHVRCAHQDHIELFAGERLLVDSNRFGAYRIGGAQLYIANQVDYARIVNNLFVGTDPQVPGHRSRFALVVGTRINRRVPRHVEIVNNTILTGAGVARYADSIRVSHHYGDVPHAARPLVANNVIAVYKPNNWACRGARRSVRNVILRGAACSPSDRVGRPDLDANGRPTAASTLLIGRADPRLAPRRDLDGRPRRGPNAPPEIGAFEYVP